MISVNRMPAALGLALVLGLQWGWAPAVLAEEPWAERTQALGAISEMPSGVLSRSELADLTAIGEALFSANFTTQDGVGRPQATQAIDPTRRKHPREQVFFRTAGPDAGSCAACHNQPVVGGAGDFVTNVFTSEGFESADFDSLDPQFSNERGSNHLFGAGLVENAGAGDEPRASVDPVPDPRPGAGRRRRRAPQARSEGGGFRLHHGRARRIRQSRRA